jgi:hypothetical protein
VVGVDGGVIADDVQVRLSGAYMRRGFLALLLHHLDERARLLVEPDRLALGVDLGQHPRRVEADHVVGDGRPVNRG